MKTQAPKHCIERVHKLARVLCGEIQRLEHSEENAIQGWDATDALEQLRSARDAAENAAERLEEML